MDGDDPQGHGGRAAAQLGHHDDVSPTFPLCHRHPFADPNPDIYILLPQGWDGGISRIVTGFDQHQISNGEFLAGPALS